MLACLITARHLKFLEIYVNKCIDGKRGYSLWTKREADYYLAMNYKNRGKLDSAITYFDESAAISAIIDEDGESGFYVNAVLNSAGLNERQGKIDRAIKLYEKVLDMDEYRNSHQKAEQSLEMLLTSN
jgi:tetratricopeptide (TPR) repeat protein